MSSCFTIFSYTIKITTTANSADPDQAAFEEHSDQGWHCLPILYKTFGIQKIRDQSIRLLYTFKDTKNSVKEKGKLL